MIGPEVIDEALQVLDVVLPGVDKTEYDLGARRYHATGELLTAETIEELRATTRSCSARSAILGAQRRARARPVAQTPLRAGPSRQPAAGSLYSGVSSPLAGVTNIDFVVVREGTEGPTPVTAARCASARRTRWPPRSASTPPSVSSGGA
ncbi:isocitrate/isopropylmalate family dehydrogenase [Mycolicibacterium sarraceniae]|uniref:isocitrate/isopropylmalate family dehydrogenase n=1 Tax=Mycolicibacterium sarraceniae TaxID=1534348 RepID=UPI001C6575BC|nr:isocitrate/isopropylmalate family dehydrogenase [Mycolicibacterium sarraceniae]